MPDVEAHVDVWEELLDGGGDLAAVVCNGHDRGIDAEQLETTPEPFHELLDLRMCLAKAKPL